MQRQTVKQSAIIISAIIGGMLFFQSCTVVRSGETAVKTRSGKYKDGICILPEFRVGDQLPYGELRGAALIFVGLENV